MAQIEEVPIGDVRPYERNPRRIPEKAVKAVARSIQEFGWQQPIVVDRDNVIIVGHTRYKAAQMLKLETVPVLVADLDPEKAQEYRIVDNRVAEYSTWDYTALVRELQEVIDIDMSAFGFSPVTLADGEQGEGDLDDGDDYVGLAGSSTELDPEAYGDDRLPVVCPYCGFRFKED